jgi:hypothetical protein
MVIINRNLEICKNNLNELDDVIVASVDSKESMRRDLKKISKEFYIYFILDKTSDTYQMR